MKDYIVAVEGLQWNNLFAVSANNSKDAINKVWNNVFADCVKRDKLKGFEPVYKKDLWAASLEDYYKDSGYDEIVCLN